MKLSRLGCFHQSQLSFLRSFIREFKDLEFKNSMLNENLDLDYIEILIREKFVFSMKNERLYILNEK